MDVTDMHQCDKDEDGQLKKQKQTTNHRYIGVSSSQMLVALVNRKDGSSMKVNVWLDMCGNTAPELVANGRLDHEENQSSLASSLV